MNILVTGASGFIGQNLVVKLLSLKHNVITLDLKQNITNTKHYQIDITNFNELMSIQDDIDIIYHLAAQSYGKGSIIDPDLDLNCNIKGTLNICRFAELKSIKKIIYTSSMAVYGNKEISIENDLPAPLSNYGVSKLAGEYYIKKCLIPYSIFRLYNTYGPGQDLTNESKGIVSAFVTQIIKGTNTIEVTGSLERYRDIIFIDDVIDALLLGLNNNTNNETFNISTNQKTTIAELINTIIDISNKKNIEVLNIGGFAGDQFGNVGNNTKLKSLGWIPKVSLYEGIQKFYNYCLGKL